MVVQEVVQVVFQVVVAVRVPVGQAAELQDLAGRVPDGGCGGEGSIT